MTAEPDFAKLRAELLEQQRHALDAALRERAEHPQQSIGLSGGWQAILSAIEGSLQALERLEREGQP